MSSQTVALNAGFKGFVSVIINADYEQQVILTVKKIDGSDVASPITFEGRGVRVHAKDICSQREYWSFGPFRFSADLIVTIRHKRRGRWRASKTVGPLAIVKRPEPDHPITFHVATVISEDSGDNSHDDCTVQVVQYK